MRNLRTFLRHGPQVKELQEAHPLVAGRGDHCDLVIDDGLASREHARFEVVGDQVFVVDLESRNGVLVNGIAVESRRELHHGDIVTVGRTPLVLARQEREPRLPASDRPRRLRRTSSVEMTTQGNVLEILVGGARISLEDGDVDGAERSARNLQVQIRRLISRGANLDSITFEDCIDLLIEVGDRANDPGWLAHALELCVLATRPASTKTSSRLVEVAQRIGVPPAHLDAYLALEGLDAASPLRELAPVSHGESVKTSS